MNACKTMIAIALLLCFGLPCDARNWYVCLETGKGKKGTKEKPAKDLGNIVSKLEDGDRIFIAEGVYLGRGENGHTQITVPVEISGGWNSTFTERDPWGAHKTIFSGLNKSKNWENGPRLSIDLSKWRKNAEHKVVVDGLILDNAGRNRYQDATEAKIVRMANPKTGEMPTPEAGGLSVAVWKRGHIEVRNCIVMNTAPTQGAFSIWGHEKSKCVVENNLACNNTGIGFYLRSSFHPQERERMPHFTFRNNTSVFNMKHSPGATFGGSALKFDAATQIEASNNLFAMNDYYGVDNASKTQDALLNNNLFVANLRGDYLEFDTIIDLEDLEDEAELLDEAEGNEVADIRPKVSKEWAKKYMARAIVDRAAAEADVKVVNSGINQLRRMLGLPVEGTSVGEYSGVWLPRISLEDVLITGSAPVAEKLGSKAPATETAPAETAGAKTAAADSGGQ